MLEANLGAGTDSAKEMVSALGFRCFPRPLAGFRNPPETGLPAYALIHKMLCGQAYSRLRLQVSFLW